MDFNAQQIKEDSLIKNGRYKFNVLDAREKKSISSGNDMINLKLSLQYNGRRITYFDSLILIPKMFWKIEHFCKATGMPEKIEEGRLMAQDCFEKEGYIDIIQKQNNQTGEIENQTKDYVKPEDLVPEEHPPSDFVDDDIPNLG